MAESEQPRIWVARHGERLDNVDPNWKNCGCSEDDTPLSDHGRVQASLTGDRLRKELEETGVVGGPAFDAIIVSPFQRCVETGHIIAERLKAAEICVEPGICEILFTYPPGYRDLNDLKKQFPLINTAYQPVLPFKELKEEKHDQDTFNRITEAVAGLIKRYKGGTILLVAHQGSILVALHKLTGKHFAVDLCSLSYAVPISPTPEKPFQYDVLVDDDTSHLKK